VLRRVWEWVARYDDEGRAIGAKARAHELAVIVTQECDLEGDSRKRAEDPMAETDLPSVLLCHAKAVTGDVRDHLREHCGVKGERWRFVRSNSDPRFQYLAEVHREEDAADVGSAAMLVDFKSFFTVRTEELYRQLRTAAEESAARFTILNCPWREHLQQRFTSYLSRVGLQRDHFVPEGRRGQLVVPDP
jgi:hypothetical protein